MSLEFALARFDGEGTAVQRYAAAKDRSRGGAPWANAVGFVEHHRHGNLVLRGTFAGHYLDIDESDHVSEKGAGEGVVAGGVLGGVLLGPPGLALGLLLGGVVGSQTGAVSESEVEPEALADQLRAAVPRAGSAILLIAEANDVDEMLAALGDDKGDVLRQALSAEQTRALEASLSDAPPAAAPRS